MGWEICEVTTFCVKYHCKPFTVSSQTLALVSPGGGVLPYKKDGGALRKFWKEHQHPVLWAWLLYGSSPPRAVSLLLTNDYPVYEIGNMQAITDSRGHVRTHNKKYSCGKIKSRF